MGTSDIIASFLLSLLEKGDGFAEVQRNSVAEQFNCAPSQINYVISTRFRPETGYIVESRRGGGGYVRIRRLDINKAEIIMHAVNSIGGAIDKSSARAILENLLHLNVISFEAARVINAAITDASFACVPVELRARLRAGILASTLINTKGVEA